MSTVLDLHSVELKIYSKYVPCVLNVNISQIFFFLKNTNTQNPSFLLDRPLEGKSDLSSIL